MIRTSLAIAVIVMTLAPSAGAYISLNGMSLNGISLNLISFNGRPLASLPTVGASTDAKDVSPRAAAAETSPLVVEAVILPTGETIDLR